MRFKSDKYEWCPEGYFVVKLSDPLARGVAEIYSRYTTNRRQVERLSRALQSGEEFRSDHEWCPPGFLPLSFADPADCEAIYTYAVFTDKSDTDKRDLAEALHAALDEANENFGRTD